LTLRGEKKRGGVLGDAVDSTERAPFTVTPKKERKRVSSVVEEGEKVGVASSASKGGDGFFSQIQGGEELSGAGGESGRTSCEVSDICIVQGEGAGDPGQLIRGGKGERKKREESPAAQTREKVRRPIAHPWRKTFSLYKEGKGKGKRKRGP